MTEEQNQFLNNFFVHVFNQIIAWEGQTIKNAGVTDLSIREMHAIEAVSVLTKTKQNTMANIAKTLSVSPGTLTTAVNVLINKGYLERSYTAKDRRVILIHLTENGERVNAIHDQFHDEMIQSLSAQLDEEHLTVLLEALGSLRRFFEQKVLA